MSMLKEVDIGHADGLVLFYAETPDGQFGARMKPAEARQVAAELVKMADRAERKSKAAK